MQTVFDIKTAIKMRIVNQPFPTDRSTRFFKVHAHYDVELVAQLRRECFEFFGVLFRRIHIMN
ncbi:Uncharacterised protein [Vibrio cholerae]|nr:Uncharacterised protein [Vibrio cholerae]CSI57420.1 Uncharacterised protein [Vibrio cholerae]